MLDHLFTHAKGKTILNLSSDEIQDNYYEIKKDLDNKYDNVYFGVIKENEAGLRDLIYNAQKLICDYGLIIFGMKYGEEPECLNRKELFKLVNYDTSLKIDTCLKVDDNLFVCLRKVA